MVKKAGIYRSISKEYKKLFQKSKIHSEDDYRASDPQPRDKSLVIRSSSNETNKSHMRKVPQTECNTLAQTY